MSFYRSNAAGTKYATLQAAVHAVTANDIVTGDPGNCAGFTTPNTPPKGVKLKLAGVVINQAGGPKGGINMESAGDIEIDGVTVIGIVPVNGKQDGYGIRLVGANGALVNGANVSYCGTNLYDSHCQNLTYQGCTAKNAVGQHNLYSANSSINGKVIDCYFDTSVNACIHFNGDLSQGKPGITTGLSLIGCTVKGSNTAITYNGVKYPAQGGKGVNWDGVQNSTMVNTLVYDNLGEGMAIFKGDSAAPCLNVSIVNCTFSANAGGDCEIEDGSTVTIFNSIFDSKPTVDSASKLTWGPNQVGVNPSAMFVAPGSNYALKPGSPAIWSGVASFNNITAPITDMNAARATVPPSCGSIQGAFTPPPTQTLTSLQLGTTPTPNVYQATGFDQNGNQMSPPIDQSKLTPNLANLAASGAATPSTAGITLALKTTGTLSVSLGDVTSNSISVTG